MDNTYNIFTAERRIDIKKECSRIVNLCGSEYILYPINLFTEDDCRKLFIKNGSEIDIKFAKKTSYYRLLTIFNYVFRHWKYRNTATTVAEYLEDMGIEQIDKPSDEKQAMLILLTITNLLNHCEQYLINTLLPIFDQHHLYSGQLKKSWDYETEIIKHNINFVLEQINYKISDYGEDRKIFTKRDADVDSVLGIDIKLDQYLLGYLDIQNQNNIQFKKHALKAIADYLEPHKQEFNGTTMKSLYDTFAFSVNNMDIRHNNESQINLNNSECKEVYNKIFRIGIHLIRDLNVREIKKEIDQYKQK